MKSCSMVKIKTMTNSTTALAAAGALAAVVLPLTAVFTRRRGKGGGAS